MTYLDYLEQKVLLERLVIGLEEPVLIKGLGELSAKIDSGNGGYNVIHGTDFHQQGNELMFTTHDSFGHDKKMQATVIDTIEVNMGGGNIESRPVIELDIKFAGEDYKKIPFSVSDRSSNTNPILISKGFVENELEALIDVGAMNISHEGIDVVYGESWLKGGDNVDLFSPIKKVTKGAVDGVKGVANGIKNTVAGTYNVGKTLAQDWAGLAKGLYGAGKSITQDAWKAGEKLAGVAGGLAAGAAGLVAATGISKLGIKMISGLAKKISFAPNLTQTDIKQIKSKIASVSDWVNVLQKVGATGGTLLEKEQSINPSKTKFIPVVSFSCQKGVIKSDKISWTGPIFGVQKLPSIFTKKIYVQGQEGRAQSWKKEIENARKGIEYLKTQNAQGQKETTEEQEEELLALAESCFLLTESDTVQDTNTEVSQEQSGEQQTQTEETADDSKQQEIITQFDDLGMFQLWFISISTDEDAFEYVTNTFIKQATFDKLFGKFYTGGKVSSDTAANIVREISQSLKKFNPQLKKKLSGMWCLALSPDANDVKKRQYHFFQQEPYLIYSKDSDIKKVEQLLSPSNEDEEWIEQKLNFLKYQGII